MAAKPSAEEQRLLDAVKEAKSGSLEDQLKANKALQAFYKKAGLTSKATNVGTTIGIIQGKITERDKALKRQQDKDAAAAYDSKKQSLIDKVKAAKSNEEKLAANKELYAFYNDNGKTADAKKVNTTIGNLQTAIDNAKTAADAAATSSAFNTTKTALINKVKAAKTDEEKLAANKELYKFYNDNGKTDDAKKVNTTIGNLQTAIDNAKTAADAAAKKAATTAEETRLHDAYVAAKAKRGKDGTTSDYESYAQAVDAYADFLEQNYPSRAGQYRNESTGALKTISDAKIKAQDIEDKRNLDSQESTLLNAISSAKDTDAKLSAQNDLRDFYNANSEMFIKIYKQKGFDDRLNKINRAIGAVGSGDPGALDKSNNDKATQYRTGYNLKYDAYKAAKAAYGKNKNKETATAYAQALDDFTAFLKDNGKTTILTSYTSERTRTKKEVDGYISGNPVKNQVDATRDFTTVRNALNVAKDAYKATKNKDTALAYSNALDEYIQYLKDNNKDSRLYEGNKTSLIAELKKLNIDISTGTPPGDDKGTPPGDDKGTGTTPVGLSADDLESLIQRLLDGINKGQTDTTLQTALLPALKKPESVKKARTKYGSGARPQEAPAPTPEPKDSDAEDSKPPEDSDVSQSKQLPKIPAGESGVSTTTARKTTTKPLLNQPAPIKRPGMPTFKQQPKPGYESRVSNFKVSLNG